MSRTKRSAVDCLLDASFEAAAPAAAAAAGAAGAGAAAAAAGSTINTVDSPEGSSNLITFRCNDTAGKR